MPTKAAADLQTDLCAFQLQFGGFPHRVLPGAVVNSGQVGHVAGYHDTQAAVGHPVSTSELVPDHGVQRNHGVPLAALELVGGSHGCSIF